MASAEQIYVDPSALRCLYLHDDRSRTFCAWRARTRGALPLTPFGRAEIVNSISLAILRGDVTAATAQAALDDFDDDIADGRLSLTDLLWRAALDRAAELSRGHTPRLGTRSLDVLHVASAQVLGCRHFVTYDGRQLALARAAGLRVSQP